MEKVKYDDKITKMFLIATMIWGAVGMLVGVIVASQLADWHLNFGLPWTSFGRLRPLHTNAVIFAFAGNAIFAGVYYSSQRLLKTRMFSDLLSRIHFWGWQLIIVAAAITLPLGITTGKEYAELEWPIDIAITVVWVVFAINFFGSLIKRREKHLYVALWFYIATIVTIAVLHIVNSLEIPVSLFKSYPVYAGAQDALVQWWYGHNAVGFLLTTPFLGMMYYFIPKASGRPVYSYRLSIIHFWALVFLYIWAGPHHLHYTALPDWAQMLGMLFSVMLLAPSWGGMINGLLTLRGAWDQIRTNPVLKFFVAAVSFYGMATFEGPLMSIRSVNALSHYTDWTIGHVHSGALGWVALLIFGMIYYLVPKLWKTDLYSVKMANAHFWLSMVGILFYVVAMWISGVTQGLMWKEINPEGYLVYPNFVDTVTRLIPMYWVRLVGGLLFLTGMLLLIYNVWKTAQKGTPVTDEEVMVSSDMDAAPTSIGHAILERKPLVMAGLAVAVILIGTLIELVPTFLVKTNVPTIASVKPYTPLELLGRDIYLREGCYNCHSQMIRPFKDEVLRYGPYSKAGEFVYDHPFQWGSRRIGPDLHRIGGKYPSMWHYRHFLNPRDVVKGSIMPAYTWFYKAPVAYQTLPSKLKAMTKLGVPYDEQTVKNGIEIAKNQAAEISAELEKGGVTGTSDQEILAIIAYLQRMGSDIGWRK